VRVCPCQEERKGRRVVCKVWERNVRKTSTESEVRVFERRGNQRRRRGGGTEEEEAAPPPPPAPVVLIVGLRKSGTREEEEGSHRGLRHLSYSCILPLSTSSS